MYSSFTELRTTLYEALADAADKVPYATLQQSFLGKLPFCRKRQTLTIGGIAAARKCPLVVPVFLKDERSATINWQKLQQRRESDGNVIAVMAAG